MNRRSSKANPAAHFGFLNGIERRSSVRFRAGWRCEQDSAPGESFDGAVVDISEHGCLFITSRRLAVGSRVRLRIYTGDSSSFRCTAEIVREAEGLPNQRLYGARFEVEEEADQVILSRGLTVLAANQTLN